MNMTTATITATSIRFDIIPLLVGWFARVDTFPEAHDAGGWFPALNGRLCLVAASGKVAETLPQVSRAEAGSVSPS
jgi:hypothetical protein